MGLANGHDRAGGHEHYQATHAHSVSLDDALDFVNTLEYDKGEPTDELNNLATAVHWFDEHSLLHSEMVDELLAGDGERSPDDRLEHIRRVRNALRELLDATVERRPPARAALTHVNRALRHQNVYELVPAADGVSLDHRHVGDPVAGALARLAEVVARELTRPEATRLRICANDECRWVFRDYSPAGRRKWCDMSTCGNRAKAARHRERRKRKPDEEPANA